jgi:hypothetical protein
MYVWNFLYPIVYENPARNCRTLRETITVSFHTYTNEYKTEYPTHYLMASLTECFLDRTGSASFPQVSQTDYLASQWTQLDGTNFFLISNNYTHNKHLYWFLTSAGFWHTHFGTNFSTSKTNNKNVLWRLILKDLQIFYNTCSVFKAIKEIVLHHACNQANQM